MSSIFKKKPQENKSQPQNSTRNEKEYDLCNSFKKIKAYSRNHQKSMAKGFTISDADIPLEDQNRGFIQSTENNSQNTSTGNPSWNNYYRLEDKFSDYNSKNENAHTDLRKELEQKIEKSETNLKNTIKDLQEDIKAKLPIQWYIWTITALTAFVSLWYCLSYSEIIKTQQSIPDNIDNIVDRIDKIEMIFNREEEKNSTLESIRPK